MTTLRHETECILPVQDMLPFFQMGIILMKKKHFEQIHLHILWMKPPHFHPPPPSPKKAWNCAYYQIVDGICVLESYYVATGGISNNTSKRKRKRIHGKTLVFWPGARISKKIIWKPIFYTHIFNVISNQSQIQLSAFKLNIKKNILVVLHCCQKCY